MERWTDDRLDDAMRSIERTLNMHEKAIALFADTGNRVIKLDAHVTGIADDTAECRNGIHELRNQLKATADLLAEQELKQTQAKLEEREQLKRERISDRRWLIGTILTVMGLIVATMGVLAATGVL